MVTSLICLKTISQNLPYSPHYPSSSFNFSHAACNYGNNAMDDGLAMVVHNNRL